MNYLPRAHSLQLLFVGFIAFSSTDALAENNFSVGVEGFRDVYHETGTGVNPLTGDPEKIDVDSHVNDYGSITAGYEHISNGYFSAIDGRYSKGEEHYKSSSGIDEQPQQETDIRVRTGAVVQAWHGQLMPYIGIGWRWYFDHGKDRFATIDGTPSAVSYDRRINQFYLPIGTTYHYTSANGWIWSPNAEIDPLLYGRVQSRLGFADQFLLPQDQSPNLTNIQHVGFGLRGEFMVGQKYEYAGWEAGPFVRYWNIQKSDLTDKQVVNGTTVGQEEPDNNRLQYGLALRVHF